MQDNHLFSLLARKVKMVFFFFLIKGTLELDSFWVPKNIIGSTFYI